MMSQPTATPFPDMRNLNPRAGMELAEDEGDEQGGYASGDEAEDADLPAEEAAVNQERE
jgi:hypothetical protein